MPNSKTDFGTEPSWTPVDEVAHDETLVETWLFRLRRERFLSRKSGKIHDYYVAHLADGVHVIALTTDQRMVMVRQFVPGRGVIAWKHRGACSMPGKTRVPPGPASCSKKQASPAIRPNCWVRSIRSRPCYQCASAPFSSATPVRLQSLTLIPVKNSRSNSFLSVTSASSSRAVGSITVHAWSVCFGG